MSIPGYWQNETGDVLRPAVAAYLRGDEIDDDQAAAIRGYLRQWMEGPWRLDHVTWLFARRRHRRRPRPRELARVARGRARGRDRPALKTAALAAPARPSRPSRYRDGRRPVRPRPAGRRAYRGSRPTTTVGVAPSGRSRSLFAGYAIRAGWRSYRTTALSFRVVAKVLRYSEQTLARRLVLIVLAEAAHDDGVVWLSHETIATKARLAASHVKRCTREMSADGVIETRKAQRGRTRINVYRIVEFPGLDEVDYDRLPFDLDSEFSTYEIRTPSNDSTVSDLRADGVGSTPSTTSDPRHFSGVCPITEPEVEPLGNLPAKVDRKAVAQVEGSLAVAVLAEWNAQTGQNLTSRDWLSKIVMRIREYPDLVLDDHAHVIAAALAAPWWTGPPTPSVVYGNGGQFERSILAAKTAPQDDRNDRRRYGPGGAPTPDEMIRRAQRLAEEGR